MDQDKKAYRQSLWVAGIVMAFALAAFLFSLPMPGNAPVFPRMASGFLFFCGGALMVGSVRRHRRGEAPEVEAVPLSALRSPASTLGIAVLYVLGFKYIGFYVSTLAMVVGYMLYMGIRSVKTIAMVTGILLVFLYWLFTIQLGVPMPRGILL